MHDIDEPDPRCDICGEQEDHTVGMIEYDWNGETGNHLSCEKNSANIPKWYVSLGDGTFIECDELPYVFLATQKQINAIDDAGGDAPLNCNDDGNGAFKTHIHIRDLVEQSHWEDHTPVNIRSTPYES